MKLKKKEIKEKYNVLQCILVVQCIKAIEKLVRTLKFRMFFYLELLNLWIKLMSA